MFSKVLRPSETPVSLSTKGTTSYPRIPGHQDKIHLSRREANKYKGQVQADGLPDPGSFPDRAGYPGHHSRLDNRLL